MWQPDKHKIHDSLLYQFMVRVSEQHQYLFHDYHQLHRWSIDHSDAFWALVWDFCGIIGDKQLPIKFLPSKVASQTTVSLTNKDTQWFANSQLNFAENLLQPLLATHQHASTNTLQHEEKTKIRVEPTSLAIIFHCEGEDQFRQQLSWQQVYEQTSQIAQYLQSVGVTKGDVVAGYLPNIPQAIIAMLATTSLGAIWTSTSPDFGVDSVVERFGQTEPKVLFGANGYRYNGKIHNREENLAQILAKLPSVQHCVLIEHIRQTATQSKQPLAPLLPTVQQVEQTTWQRILKQNPPSNLSFTAVAFNDPLYILYSSGTTGKPKCIVHSVGGTLLNHLKEHQLHCDIKPGDNIFYFTTCGWMMWNWLVSGLASGTTLILYDGSPFYPNGEVLWHLAEQENVSLFGTSAKYLEALEKQGYQPNQLGVYPALRTLCSTGSVLAPEQFDYVYRAIKSNLQLSSISGGTDICGCFVIGNPLVPVYRGACQGPALAMDVQVYDPQGSAVIEQQGELVCCNSFPNQPIGFWRDHDGCRYHQAYWQTYPNTWHHGDFVMHHHHGGFTFFGRSDAVLNPGGVRIGTAEIYRQVNPLPEIVDSVVIGQQWQNDIRVVLFVQLQSEHALTDALKATLCQRIKQNCSPRHVPSVILTVNDIPRTKSGKLVELAVKEVVEHRPVNNIGALANPEALKEFADRVELQPDSKH
ncbi:acetoacetyl-CoA synthetase [Photobacterium jeanii]|uniref:Acetoacetyl-CoA synthetase n=2 Tax=Photobacterium jeanii TaxID=858640 RepID=A0A178K3L3_9GAMM|nr:acetoacetyl-CoA synthetase [Photobacterium jeanii]